MINLEDYIKDQLENINIIDLVKQQITSEINSTIKREIKKWTEEKVKELMTTEIEILFENKIETNDGWGRIELFDSFEILFKQTLYKKMSDSWGAKSIIKSSIEEKVKKLYENDSKEFFVIFKDFLDKNVKQK